MPETTQERITKIIEMLEHVKPRPAMFAGSVTTSAVGAYLSGFGTGCMMSGLPPPHYSLVIKATEKRGWPGSAECWSVSAMRERGLTEAEIVDEMIQIEIDAWKMMAAELALAEEKKD